MEKEIKFIETYHNYSLEYMESHFISYESAVLMNRMECKWFTDEHYRASKPDLLEHRYVENLSDCLPGETKYIKAYTIEEAARWLLDTQEILISIRPDLDLHGENEDEWSSIITDIGVVPHKILKNSPVCHRHEICMRDAIKFALEYIAERGVYINKQKKDEKKY